MMQIVLFSEITINAAIFIVIDSNLTPEEGNGKAYPNQQANRSL